MPLSFLLSLHSLHFFPLPAAVLDVSQARLERLSVVVELRYRRPPGGIAARLRNRLGALRCDLRLMRLRRCRRERRGLRALVTSGAHCALPLRAGLAFAARLSAHRAGVLRRHLAARGALRLGRGRKRIMPRARGNPVFKRPSCFLQIG